MYIYLENDMKVHVYKNVQSMFKMRLQITSLFSTYLDFSVLYDKQYLYKTMLFKNMS